MCDSSVHTGSSDHSARRRQRHSPLGDRPYPLSPPLLNTPPCLGTLARSAQLGSTQSQFSMSVDCGEGHRGPATSHPTHHSSACLSFVVDPLRSWELAGGEGRGKRTEKKKRIQREKVSERVRECDGKRHRQRGVRTSTSVKGPRNLDKWPVESSSTPQNVPTLTWPFASNCLPVSRSSGHPARSCLKWPCPELGHRTVNGGTVAART